MVVGQYLAGGSGDWFNNEARVESLREGWTSACDDAGATYGCGETPTLRDIIYPTTVDLAGASMGIIKPKDRLMDPHNIQHGDAIVMLASSGVHSNGLTGMRDLADLISYHEPVPDDGRMFGEAILDPTPIYVPIIEDILNAGIRPRYGVNITGHGWRKLTRWVEPYLYRITKVPTPQPIFGFIQDRMGKSLRNMYDALNMGAGFAIFCDPADAQRIIEIAAKYGIEAWVAGGIEESSQTRLIIEPLDLTFEGDSLGVR
jgi:phosphoribosylformylglycinamidine cyclo-ligase